MSKDIEYMLVETTGLESVVFSSNRLKDIAKFCNTNYDHIKKYKSTGQEFRFENEKVKVIAIDMRTNYERS